MAQTRLERLLEILTDETSTYYTVHYLADRIGCPEASVRRDIQQLRRQGHNVSYGTGSGDGYRLWYRHLPGSANASV